MRAVLVAVLFVVGCDREPVKLKPPSACLVDDLGELRQTPRKVRCDGDDPCRERCDAADADACYERGLALETRLLTKPAATEAYRRGCALGLGIACTNYAAHLRSGQTTTRAQLRCAARIFDKVCATGESFACGMAGRMILDGAHEAAAIERGRELLERSCRELQGFPCRMLARQLESGQLGSYDPARIPALLERACAGGDTDACGATSTVRERPPAP